MDKLINDLSPAIEKLAEIFCVSVEYLQEHLMEYVLMYGKYHFWSNIGLMFLLMMFAGVFSVMIGLLIGMLVYDFNGDWTDKAAGIILFVCFIIPVIIAAFCWIAPYIFAPEMYSIKAVLSLING